MFSGDDLEATGADSFADYLLEIPGTGFRQDGSGQTKIGIRGVSNVSGNQLGTFSGASPIGVYLNDVPIQGSGQLPDLDLYDLARIEILKGPQGTLYGEGAMGGAIRMIVNSPSLTDWDFKSDFGVSITEHGGINSAFKVAGGAPVIHDHLGFRLVAVRKDDSGFIDLPNQGREDANTSDLQSLRALSAFALGDLSGEILYLNDQSNLDASPNVRPETKEKYENDILEHEFSRSDLNVAGLSVNYDFPWMRATSVTSFLTADRFSVFRLPLLLSTVQGNFEDNLNAIGIVIDPADVARLGFDVANIEQEPEHNSTGDLGWTEEIRLVSEGDQRLRWITGLYYQLRKQDYDQTLYTEPPPTPNENRNLHRDGFQKTWQIALFGEAVYSLLTNLDLTVGLRVFHEEVRIKDFFETYGIVAALQATGADENPKTLDTTGRYQNVLPKVSLSWHPYDEHTVYGVFSRGYRTTTPNVQFQLGTGPPLLDPDFLWNYELGTRSQWLDSLLSSNLAVFYIDWQDLQAVRVGDGMLGAIPVDVIYIDNIGNARIIGTDFGVTTASWNGLTLGAAAGYQRGTLEEVREGSPAIPGSRIPNSPEWSWNVNGEYERPIFRELTFLAGAALQFVDDQATIEVTAVHPDGNPTASYKNLMAQASVEGASWGVTVFADNLLNDLIELQNASLVDTEHFTTLGRPRTAGVRLRVFF